LKIIEGISTNCCLFEVLVSVGICSIDFELIEPFGSIFGSHQDDPPRKVRWHDGFDMFDWKFDDFLDISDKVPAGSLV